MNRPTEPEHSEPAGDPVDELLAEAGVDDPRVTAVLSSAATPDEARVRRGEEAALAAFRRARAKTASAPHRRSLVGTILVAAAAAAVIFLLSLAAAGGRDPSAPVPDGDSNPADIRAPEPSPAHGSRHASPARSTPPAIRSPGRSAATPSAPSKSDAPHGTSSDARGKSNSPHAAKASGTPRVKPSPHHKKKS